MKLQRQSNAVRLIGLLLVAGLVAGLGAVVALSPARGEAVSMRFAADKGDTFKVRVTKRSKEDKSDGASEEGPFSFNYDGEVLDGSASGFRIRWTLKSVSMPGTAADNEALSSSMLTLMKDIPLEFDAGPNGAPVAIPNFKAILPRLMAVVREILTSDEGKAPDPEVIARTEAAYRAMSPQVAATNFLPEAVLVGAMQNLVLDTDVPKVTQSAQRNPLGGPPIKTISEIRLASVDKASGFALITWTTQFDRPSMIESVKALIQSMRKPDQKELPQEALDMMGRMTVERNDSGRALVSLDDGWVRKVYYRQQISNSVMNQTSAKDETWLIEIDRRAK